MPSSPLSPTRRYRLTVAYDGGAFHGWQKQHPPGGPPEGLRTVQGVLERRLRELLGQPLTVMGASRTDAGVHALGQSASFEAACPIPLERLAQAINSRLPPDMEVRDAAVVPETFDVIGDVVSKQYRYRIFAADHRPLWLRGQVYHCWLGLNPSLMADAAARLVGTHDIAGFAAADHGRTTTIRTLHRCEVLYDQPTYPDEIHIIVEGSGFLYHSVRIIAGTLVEVGRGAFPPSRIDDILRKADRRLAGPTLPPQALRLEWVRYSGTP